MRVSGDGRMPAPLHSVCAGLLSWQPPTPRFAMRGQADDGPHAGPSNRAGNEGVGPLRVSPLPLLRVRPEMRSLQSLASSWTAIDYGIAPADKTLGDDWGYTVLPWSRATGRAVEAGKPL